MTTNMIEELIASKRAMDQESLADTNAAIQKMRTKAVAACEKEVPGWDQLRQHITSITGNTSVVDFRFQPPGELALDPFMIRVVGEHALIITFMHDEVRNLYKIEQAAEFYALMRARYEEKKNRAHAQEVKRLVDKLDTPSLPHDEAKAAYDRLMEIEPKHSENWDNLLIEWERKHAWYKNALAEERQAKEAHELAKKLYYNSYKEWCATKAKSIADANACAIAVLNNYDARQVTLYRLEYGITGDGAAPATRTCYVLNDVPDSGGYWYIQDHGNLTPTRIMNVVSITSGIVVTPATHPELFGYLVSATGVHIPFFPFETPEKANEINDKLRIPAIPAEPEAPSGLSSYDIRDIQRNVEVDLYDEQRKEQE